MNRPVIGRVGRQPFVSVSASVRACVRVCGPSVCVALQSRGRWRWRWRCLLLWLPLLHWPHCSASRRGSFTKSKGQNAAKACMVSFCELRVMRSFSFFFFSPSLNVNMMQLSSACMFLNKTHGSRRHTPVRAPASSSSRALLLCEAQKCTCA